LSIPLKKPKEIDAIRKSSILVARTLNYLSKEVSIGMTLKEIDNLGDEFIVSNGGRPSFKGLYGFPSAVCTSLNAVIIHGVPDDTVLKEGDILGIDVGVEIDGWYGDAAITIPVGKISKKNEDLIACAKDTLYYAIDIIRPNMRFKELSLKIEKFITSKGFLPLHNYCGHGIGSKPHEDPQILNYLEGTKKQGPKIKNGMVFCLEPMITQKLSEAKVLEDKWSVLSKDELFGSHYEHTIAVINNKAEILSKEE
jgi:methionyl aminopeptidase